MIGARRGKLFCLLLGCLLAEAVHGETEPWLRIDTRERTVKVMQGNQALDVFEGVAIGRNGAGTKRKRGDKVTPVGVFRVGWINARSRYHLFIGLDYPNLDYARQAYQQKRIDGVDYFHIRVALEQGRVPPQDTPLGGAIGIHGVGAGNAWVHANFDWTDGCVALDNQQIWRLAQWVQVGTRVEIR